MTSSQAIIELSPDLAVSHKTKVGNWTINNRVKATLSELEELALLLDQAENNRQYSNPLHSGFTVGAACSTTASGHAKGFNYESYNLDLGTHAEQLAIGDMLKVFGRHSRVELMAITTGLESHHTSCCGHCRHWIESYAATGKDIIIASGAQNKTATLWRLYDLVPDIRHFQKTSFADLIPEYQDLCRQAVLGASRSLNFLTGTDEKSAVLGAAVLGESLKIYRGGKRDTAGYYARTSVDAAIDVAINSEGGENNLRAMACFTRTGVVDGLTKQIIYETASGLGRDSSMPIFIVGVNGNDVIQTTPNELLPYGFGWNDLGIKWTEKKTTVLSSDGKNLVELLDDFNASLMKG